MRIEKKMSVPLYIQHKTVTPATKMMKLVRTDGRTSVYTTKNTPFSVMPKTTRENLHRGINVIRRHRNLWRFQMTKMEMTTKPVPKTSTAMATATEKVTGILSPEEGQRNG